MRGFDNFSTSSAPNFYSQAREKKESKKQLGKYLAIFLKKKNKKKKRIRSRWISKFVNIGAIEEAGWGENESG